MAAETHKHADCHARFLPEFAAITFAGGADPTSGTVAALSEPRRGTPGRFFAGICAGGKKQESHWASQHQRLAYLMRVDWPAQPYMKPAQVI